MTTRAATFLPLCILACQAKREPSREQTDPSELVSRMEDPQMPAAAPVQKFGEAPPSPTPPAAERAPLPPLPDPLPGIRKDVTASVGKAWRAAMGDLDGDGDQELVVVDSEKLRALDSNGRELASLQVARGIHALTVADIDGDGRAEVIAGWGISRDHMDTKVAFTVHQLRGAKLTDETIVAPGTSRNDASAIIPMPDAKSVLLAYFDSKYNVSTVVAKRGASGWETTKLASLRTATSYARGDVDYDGVPDIVVGRVYGEDKGLDGDSFILRPDATRVQIPTTRGLRSVAVFDSDGDKRLEVFMSDGWHQNYGDNARGLLTRATYVNGQFKSELVEDTAGQYSIDKLVPMSLDGKPALVAMGSHYVRVYQRNNGVWRAITIAGPARDVAVGDFDGIPGDDILILAEKSELVNLRNVALQPLK